MSEEFGNEVTPQQSLDGLWGTMHKYIKHHGISDISLELEGAQYEFQEHLEKYREYKVKAEALNKLVDVWNDPGISDVEVNAIFADKLTKDGDS